MFRLVFEIQGVHFSSAMVGVDTETINAMARSYRREDWKEQGRIKQRRACKQETAML